MGENIYPVVCPPSSNNKTPPVRQHARARHPHSAVLPQAATASSPAEQTPDDQPKRRRPRHAPTIPNECRLPRLQLQQACCHAKVLQLSCRNSSCCMHVCTHSLQWSRAGMCAGETKGRQQAAPREDRHASTTRQCAEAPEPHLWHTSSKGCNFTLVV